ncbi:MAG: demethoxyubiquinone hydroxylase family protein [Pelagibacteraceae bacterium]|jgi:ubiquinone biosynthesis monooxygenase Coq7
MKKNNKIEEIIRVDHAGERGAVNIYDGQLLALQLLKSDPDMESKISEMKEHEKEHLKYFEQQLAERKVRPTLLLPLWDMLGVSLGFVTGLMGKKATMLCTASVEEVIDQHYQSQINYLQNEEKNEKDLLNKIKKFRQDELDHRDLAYEEGATKKGPFAFLDLAIKTGSRIAIEVAKRI